MTVALATGAPSANVGSWISIDWTVVYKFVHRLQMRIAKAVAEERWHKVAALSRLLTRSYYAKLWAVRRVVANKGKNTAGVDRIIWKTPKQKVNAVKALRQRGYQPMPLRRIYIPKSNGKQRPLGIPTMKDRAMQALYALALTPIAESLADANSYGFREKRSVADAIAQCFNCLAKKASPLIKPSRDKVSRFMERIRDYVQSKVSVQADRFLRGLNSRLRGFANFYRHVISKKTFSEIDQQVYQLLRNWMLRRHRNKTLAWCKHKHIKRWGTRWQFTASTIKEGKSKSVRLFKVADLPIIRHVKVRATAHPYNPLDAEYFEQQRNRQWLRRKKDSRFLAVPAIERMV